MDRKTRIRKAGIKRKKYLIVLAIAASMVIICTVIAVSFLYLSNKNKPKLMPETLKTEVKKLPSEIKKKLIGASESATFRVPILMYHYVEYVRDKKDTIRQSLDVTPYTFEQQIITLQNAGYTFLTAKDFGDILDDKAALPSKPVLLTFDDGHWDLYTDILPILKKYKINATAYIIPGFINRPDFLSSIQLQAVSDSGLIEIGAHTVHHMWLKGKSLQFVQSEVDSSKLMLETLLKKQVVSFAYPYGAFDQQAEDVVRKDGFKTAVSTVPGILDSKNNRYFLYRIRPGGRIGESLLKFLEQTTFRPW